MKLYKAIKNCDEGVFGCPKVTGDLFGYKKVNTYFVDNSGFGSETEPALTIPYFLSKVKQGYYYGITNVGQFQVYIGEYIKDKTSRNEKLAELGYISRKKVANNTYEYITTEGDRIIHLHNTDILRFKKDGKIILNTGGYDTVTTRTKCNEFLPEGLSVRRIRGISYIIDTRGGKLIQVALQDNITI